MPELEGQLRDAQEDESQLEFAKTEYDTASKIAVDVSNASMKAQKDDEETRDMEDEEEEADAAVAEVAD
jgi:hypothetical protein